MFEELEIIKSIVTELSGAGLGFGLAYVAYLFISKLAILIGSIWIINELSKRVVDVIKCDVTKDQASELVAKAKSAKIEADNARREAEEIKHKYKIMMEKKANE